MNPFISDYPNERLAVMLHTLLVKQEISRSLNPKKRISNSEAHHVRNAAITIAIGFLLAITLTIALFMTTVVLLN